MHCTARQGVHAKPRPSHHELVLVVAAQGVRTARSGAMVTTGKALTPSPGGEGREYGSKASQCCVSNRMASYIYMHRDRVRKRHNTSIDYTIQAIYTRH